MNPKELSERLARENTFVPGVRQGKQTEKYLTGVINRVTFGGTLALILIALVPVLLTIIFNLNSVLAFGGTSVIILVGVAVEVNDQIDAKLAGADSKTNHVQSGRAYSARRQGRL